MQAVFVRAIVRYATTRLVRDWARLAERGRRTRLMDMTLLRLALPLLALAALPACILPIPVPEGTPGAFEVVLDEGDSCGARGLQDYVGQDASVVRGTVFQSPVPVRVVGPDDVATDAGNPQRVTFVTDASGQVVTVGCG